MISVWIMDKIWDRVRDRLQLGLLSRLGLVKRGAVRPSPVVGHSLVTRAARVRSRVQE